MKKILAAILAVSLAGVVLVPRFGEDEIPPPRGWVDPSEAVMTVSRGEEVELLDHTSPEAWTVVEFTADW